MRIVQVPKNDLMLIAGLVWCAAGAIVCLIGLPLEFGLAPSHLILAPRAVVIFLVFYVFVFSPMPDWMIAFFYSGLGVALFLCGVRFLGVFARKEVLAPASERFRVDG